MDRQRRPEIGAAEPFLFGDEIFGVFDAVVPEFEVAIIVIISLAPEFAIRVDGQELDSIVAELVGGKERAIRPAECDPGNGGLGLKLRQEHEFASLLVANIEHLFSDQRAHGD